MVYLDNAATTPMYPECVKVLEEYAVKEFFNPSALYAPSVKTAVALNDCRRYIIKVLKGEDNADLIFTASGSEADNIALLCTKKMKNGKIIVSEAEHSAVYNCATELKNRGYEVTFAPVNSDGSLNIEAFESLLDDKVCLVSVMHVSNETGAVNDLSAIGKLIRKKAPSALFHSDGVQAVFKTPVNLAECGVDMYSFSAHKFHGPKGVGALYVRKGVSLSPVIFGGGQEKGIRSATENVPGIMAMKKAFEINAERFKVDYYKKRDILEYLRQKLSDDMDIRIVSPANSPHILLLAFKDVRGEVLMHALEKYGVYVGIGSACSSRKGVGRLAKILVGERAFQEGIIRISVSDYTEKKDVDLFIDAVYKEYALLKKFVRV